MIKGQDILVLVSLMGDNAGLAYAELGKRSRLSVSETLNGGMRCSLRILVLLSR